MNPHWEMDWMSDRQKNFEKKPKSGDPNQNPPEKSSLQYSPHTISFQADGFHTKYKKHENNQVNYFCFIAIIDHNCSYFLIL